MADWSLPTLADLKVDVMSMLKGREVDAYTLAENPTNPPVGAKRFNHSLNKFESYNGDFSAGNDGWVDLVISIAGGGTGATDINGFIDNFNLGSMALQDSNAVNITGGTISGLTSLSTAGNATIGGILYAGSAPTPLTNSAGQILETAIADGTLLARVGANETITGSWTFAAAINVTPNIYINFQQDAFTNRLSIGEYGNANAPSFFQAGEGGVHQQHTIISNNYYSPGGGGSQRCNLALGGSFIRLSASGEMTFTSISAAGAYNVSLSTSPSYTRIGAGIGQTEVRLVADGNGPMLTFHGAGVQNGRIVGYSNGLYYDANTHYWRNGAGTVTYAVLDTNGKFASYGLQTNNGCLYNASSVMQLNISAGHWQAFSSVFYFTNYENTFHPMTLVTATGVLALPLPSAEINIGGARGAGLCISRNSSANAAFYCHGAGGETSFFNCMGNLRLISYNDTAVTITGQRLYAPPGSAIEPGIAFSNNPGAGLYYNSTTAQCVEFGCNFNLSTRSIMRAHSNVAQVDWYIGDYYMYQMGPWPNHRVMGHFSPNAAGSYYCGEPSLYWYQLHSLHGYVTLSDIRTKDVDRDVPDDILDLIDSVVPFIASSKESEYDGEHKLIDKDEFLRKFPTLSAQDIREKIDGPLGVQTVFGKDKLGIEYGRLTPLLWAAIRRLNARLKRLES